MSTYNYITISIYVKSVILEFGQSSGLGHYLFNLYLQSIKQTITFQDTMTMIIVVTSAGSNHTD